MTVEPDKGGESVVVVSCTNPECDHWRTSAGGSGVRVASAIEYGGGIACDFCGEPMRIYNDEEPTDDPT